MSKISKEIPLAELTFRRYEKPNTEGRELVRKLCLSVGLLQPGDSRDVIVDVLHVILKEKEIAVDDVVKKVVENRQSHNLPLAGIAPSNVRRQLKRLKDLFLIENIDNKYRLTEKDKLLNIFEEKVEQYLLKSVIGRVKEYYAAIDDEFSKK
ncbi:MAG: hypothetical protein QW331_01555 [Candidatus Woesearchaeota archaeon]